MDNKTTKEQPKHTAPTQQKLVKKQKELSQALKSNLKRRKQGKKTSNNT